MVLPPNLAKFGETVEKRVAPPIYRRSRIVTLSESSRDELIHELKFEPHARIESCLPASIRASRPEPGRARSRHSPRRRRRPADAGQALRRADQGRWPRCAARIRPSSSRSSSDGAERENLEALVADLDASDWVSMPGRLSDDALVELYRRAWVLASASAAEGWGMTVTEAAACGTPAVVTDIPGHRDAVQPGVTGLLSPDMAHARAMTSAACSTTPTHASGCGAPALARAARAHVGGHGDGHARRARRGSDAPSALRTLELMPARWRGPHSTSPSPLGRVRPAAPHPPRRGQRGHQDLPLPRPRPAARQGAVHVGPGHRARHGDPPDHRLPLPDGAVLLAHADPRVPRLGRATDLARHDLVRGRRGRAVPDAHDGLEGRRSDACPRDGRRRRGLHALPVRPRLRRAHLGDPPAVRGAALAHRHGDAGRPRGWMAVAGVVRTRHRDRRRRQRDRVALRGIGPVLWFVYAMWVSREIAVRRALAAIGRIGALTIGVSLWWIAGLWAQGEYGIPILRYTETYETVAQARSRRSCCAGSGTGSSTATTSSAPGSSRASPTRSTCGSSVPATLPAIAWPASPPELCGGSQRGYFVALVAIGTIIAVGAHPFDDPTPYGSLFKPIRAISTSGSRCGRRHVRCR